MRIFLSLLLIIASTATAFAQATSRAPSADEVQALLKQEPINDATWPKWKQRLTDWFGDTTRSADPAYRAATQFVGSRANAMGELPAQFDNDHLAWYLLGSYFVERQPPQSTDLEFSERAYRRCVAIDPKFARGHRNLACALAYQVTPPEPGKGIRKFDRKLDEASKEVRLAAQLDPQLSMAYANGMIAQRRGDHAQAVSHFEEALRKDPNNPVIAEEIAISLISDTAITRPAARIEPLTRQFSNNGALATLHAIALAHEKRLSAANAELERARSLGFDPNLLAPDAVARIEENAQPGIVGQFLTVMMWFAIAYAGIMLTMAIAGVILANRTRGTGALDLLRKQDPAHLVQQGHIARGSGESALARLYGFALMVGLILFYAAIPFIIAGLLGVTGLMLYLIFLMPRIPLKLVAIVVVVGGFSAWAVFKSLFTKPATGGFGLLKTSAECPQLHQLLTEVARQVDTDPVNEVFLAPGASIGVHQEGRGPFGMFGVNKRVLTLGFCTLRFLTVGELKAILAHEYAHFSHSDTFYSRFIYQVHISIEEALYGMQTAGGIITKINPFYWFLWLYYKSYSLLAAGYSRSREFLADRMAATLYGPEQFKSALEKVSTDGTLFEMTMYNHISDLLREQKMFLNMYDAFVQMRDEQISHDDRNKLYQDLLGEKGSLFASHPTFTERIEAIQGLPAGIEPDNRPALELFEQPKAMEEELTKFLTDYMAYIAHMQALADAQAQQG